jgi:selenocysteine-specific elongation factor
MIRGIIGTGGHVDHGKTALVEALTGVWTDRLPEEQRRGITIDLGFARLDTDDGAIGLVDVPGHEDFIRNMVAGASGFDLLLLVVAADEGVMPQTREHVAIAELLGVPAAVVALTKIDLVEPEWLELAVDDVATFLEDTAFAGAPIVPTSAVARTGLDILRTAVDLALPGPRGHEQDLFRLPVDRAFSVHGTGTVVTGTVWSGTLRRDDHVRILPGDRTARVRGLQVHGGDVAEVRAGQRAAIALAGVERDQAPRGATLVTDATWAQTRWLTALLRVLPGTEWSIDHGQRVRVHLGTTEVMARALLLDARTLEPGDEGLAQLRLEAPVVARAGDRILVRSYSPVTTIGGGVVAEPDPRRRRRRGTDHEQELRPLLDADPVARIHALVRRAGVAGVAVVVLPVRAGAAPADVERALHDLGTVIAGAMAFPPDAEETVAEALVEAVAAYHARHPLRPGMDAQELRRAAPEGTAEPLLEHALQRLLSDRVLTKGDGVIARAGFEPALTDAQRQLQERILQAVEDAGYAPPRIDDLRHAADGHRDFTDLLALLQAAGRVRRIEHELVIHQGIVDRIVDAVRARFAGRTDVTPAEFRDVIPASRRHLIPILEYLDRTGVTVRAGEGRAVPGSD